MRRSGKTTRLVDRWIQEFFEKGITYIYEGRGEKSEKEQTEHAFKRFRNRMVIEHYRTDFDVEYGEFDRIKCFKVTKKVTVPSGAYIVPAGVVDEFGNLKK